MKRWLYLLITGLIIAAYMTGCSRETAKETQEEVVEQLEVTVVSNGISYVPFENDLDFAIHETEKDEKEAHEADISQRLTPEMVMADTEHGYHMPEVFFADDFKIRVKGNGTNPVSYMIYDKDYLPVDSGKVADPADITIPADGYDYYVQLETASGDEKNPGQCQYFFKVVRGEPLPQIRITYEKKSREIPSASGMILWNEPGSDGEEVNTAACGPDPFETLSGEESDIPYLPLGRHITMELSSDKELDTAVLTDYILRDNGTLLYDEKTAVKTELEWEGHEMEFILPQNTFAMLSSDIATYETGGVLRGFKLQLSWEDGSEAEYGFLLRTDAAWVGENPADVETNRLPETEPDVYLDIRRADNMDFEQRLVMEINNQSDVPILFGNDFTLMKITGTEMAEVPMKPEMAWKSIAYQVSAGSYKALTVDMEEIFGRLESGHYRIKKNVRADGEGIQTVTADFIVIRQVEEGADQPELPMSQAAKE